MTKETENKKVQFNKKDYLGLKKAYNKAVENKDVSFTFKGNYLMTSYAKYLLEYLKASFEK